MQDYFVYFLWLALGICGGMAVSAGQFLAGGLCP